MKKGFVPPTVKSDMTKAVLLLTVLRSTYANSAPDE
jgi:hypothetical protein